jgi:hypothetical protein
MSTHAPDSSTFESDSPASLHDSGGAGGIERRRSHREPVYTLGQLRSLTQHRPTSEQVMVTNVSLHGVGFRCGRRLELDGMYEIEIGVGPLHLSSRLRVVRSRLRADGTHDIGGEFC